ncbi:GntR family transcriptional regulator [Rhodobacteraceae bacterium NNCM2]|nr:GntR family transcriptional regulator [Coraliihabitans acroporae]
MSENRLALSRSDLTLNSRLVAAMRKAILDGELPPGRHLKERELCDMFEVSRSLVRESVQTLVAEDLLTVIPHRGIVVTMVGREAARNLYGVRAVLEGLACKEFTENADEESRAELFDAADRINELPEGDPSSDLVAAKNNYYDILLRGCGNDILALLFTQLNNRIVQLRRLSLSQEGRLPVTKREIAAIIDAIRERKPVKARRLAEEHVASAAAVADKRFDELEKENPPKEES